MPSETDVTAVVGFAFEIQLPMSEDASQKVVGGTEEGFKISFAPAWRLYAVP